MLGSYACTVECQCAKLPFHAMSPRIKEMTWLLLLLLCPLLVSSARMASQKIVTASHLILLLHLLLFLFLLFLFLFLLFAVVVVVESLSMRLRLLGSPAASLFLAE
ncbi:unnamed protein product [Polarella glacialis]|uniref:Uncharacterized protein n=1 Tax=Polarella glacialis TaxID=89957 RepID=A0A813LMY2_POLGL|nr:unnamed protein product [Polarella glacialis]